ncbi:hypothetical protein [Caenibius sp. WL]|uniref:hypothetical protein n=1 Tax=Caenibius sp. WL TaxID=2872646 RepID=UPI001C98FA9B|nr:hypothetical protein [Caenibius sp. WL]QZP07794.1 hypothetical protein K5X80_14245 [Caenibius sp. WL]QZP09973.1 hypothetical protein K5X80_16960 [Caenibius sp. WL]
MDSNTVVPNGKLPSEAQYRDNLILGLSRVSARHGRGQVADKSGRTTRALDKLFSGGSHDTTGKGLLDFLAADLTALDEVLALYGVGIRPLRNEAANDLHTISSLSNLAGQFAAALEDGHRCHVETLQLADAARPLMKALGAICSEADQIKGAA